MLSRVARLALGRVGIDPHGVVAAIPGAFFRAPGLCRARVVEPVI